jgi:ankyrin repeat protein
LTFTKQKKERGMELVRYRMMTSVLVLFSSFSLLGMQGEQQLVDEMLRNGTWDRQQNVFKNDVKNYVKRRSDLYEFLKKDYSRPVSPGQSGSATKIPVQELIEAASGGDAKKVSDIIRGSTGDYKTVNASVALGHAGDSSMVDAVFRAYPEANVNAKDRKRGNTPLHWVAIRNNVPVIKALLNRGANVNAMNNDGVTPLMFAAQGGHSWLLQVLLNAGADAKLKAQDNVTLFKGRDSEPSGVMHSEIAWKIDSEGISLPGKPKIKFDELTGAFGGKGRTALHWVVRMTQGAHKKRGEQMSQETSATIVTILMANGADMYAKDFPWEVSVLDWAIFNDQHEVVSALIEGRKNQLGISVAGSAGPVVAEQPVVVPPTVVRSIPVIQVPVVQPIPVSVPQPVIVQPVPATVIAQLQKEVAKLPGGPTNVRAARGAQIDPTIVAVCRDNRLLTNDELTALNNATASFNTASATRSSVGINQHGVIARNLLNQAIANAHAR